MTTSNITGQLVAYMAGARSQNLPPELARQVKFRILDTLATMISGSRLKAGEMAIRHTLAQGGAQEATVLSTNIRTSAGNAALANAMFAHADETDDFEPTTKAHPGSHVVPAALAMAERRGSSGKELMAAVALGQGTFIRAWSQHLGLPSSSERFQLGRNFRHSPAAGSSATQPLG